MCCSPVISYTGSMAVNDASEFPCPQAPRQFASTHWSLVAAAGQRESPASAAALASLCRLYWYPLYAYARRRLPTAEDAQDLTQDFFAQLLEKEYLRQVDRQRGSFRAFLLTAFKHFLAKERERANAQKRGGGRAHLPLDFQVGERRYQLEPTHAADAEALYERRWALTLLEQTLAKLRDELTRAGKGRLFEALKGTLTGADAPRPYAELADELGLSAEAIKVTVHRLRRRYGELLRTEIAQTVSAPAEIEEELHNLFAALGGKKV
jgi:RNA polymerase sigma factor (sigma-70 family)